MTHPALLPKERLRTITERHEIESGFAKAQSTALDAAHSDRAALLSHIAASGWQPISSAPRDVPILACRAGTRIQTLEVTWSTKRHEVVKHASESLHRAYEIHGSEFIGWHLGILPPSHYMVAPPSPETEVE